MPKSLEVGPTASRYALVGPAGDSSAIVVVSTEPGDMADPDLFEKIESLTSDIESLTNKIESLTNENRDLNEVIVDLKGRIAVLTAQNQLLAERLRYNDELIINLTGPR
jgi:predicted RNase H-like nuclease (RuvC/YqgF family)